MAQSGGFCSADKLESRSTNYLDELEERIRVQDNIIAAQEETISQLEATPRPPRGPSEDLATSERLILLARINDLTVERNALEIDLRAKICRLETIVTTYLPINEEIFKDDETALLLRAALMRKAEAAKEHSSQIADLEDRMSDVEDHLLVEQGANTKLKDTALNREHIELIWRELLRRKSSGVRGITYADTARLLNLSKARVCQIRSLISSDSRFNVVWHPNKKNTKLICLKNYK